MENTTQERDARIAAASTQAYNNINTALNITELPSRAKRSKFSLFVIHFVFEQLASKGVDKLPYQPGSINKDEANELASDFIDTYDSILWPDSIDNDGARDELNIAVRNFFFVMFSLNITASEFSEDPDTKDPTKLINQFHAAEPDDVPEQGSGDTTMTDFDDDEDEVFCSNCGGSFLNRPDIEVHWENCLLNYRRQYGSASAGQDAIPRIFQSSTPAQADKIPRIFRRH